MTPVEAIDLFILAVAVAALVGSMLDRLREAEEARSRLAAERARRAYGRESEQFLD